jgi:hypothetical protein
MVELSNNNLRIGYNMQDFMGVGGWPGPMLSRI